MPEPEPRIRWEGDIAAGGGKNGYINEIRVAHIHRTSTWKDAEKPFCLDYAHGLHCESAHFDSIREAMDATEGLLCDFLSAIDADWLPEDERWLLRILREVGKQLRERVPNEEAQALWERLQQRYVQEAPTASGPIADPGPEDDSAP